MHPIATFADLYRAGAHHIAQGLLVAGRGLSAFVSRLRERFAGLLVATRDTLVGFWNATRSAVNAADILLRGRVPGLGEIPQLPGELFSSRFRYQGIVTIKSPTLGEPGRPLKTTLPFTTDSPTPLSLDDFIDELNKAIEADILAMADASPKGQRARDKARYIRDSGEPIEYDITPLFVWKTH